MVTLRDYQKDIVQRGMDILDRYHMLYLMMETRTGKTLTVFEIAKRKKKKNIIVFTKKKVVPEIQKQADEYGITITVINYESAHKLKGKFDFVIIDEAHHLGTFPKTSNRWKKVKALCPGAEIVYLSATATPESWSSIFHQLRLSDYDPFAHYSNFYKWAEDFVNVTRKYHGSHQSNDYSDAKIKKIQKYLDPIRITLTQEEAGFTTTVNETILSVEMSGYTHKAFEFMKDDDLLIFGDTIVEGETAAGTKSKCHQLASGTIKHFDDYHVFDESKGWAIRRHAENYGYDKIAIYYKYIAERQILDRVFEDLIVTDPFEFQKLDKAVFASQVFSGREGIRLDTADCLYMFNIDFAWLSYEQTKNRIMSFEREDPAKLIWVFSDTGYEKEILKRVMKKENFTVKHFRRI